MTRPQKEHLLLNLLLAGALVAAGWFFLRVALPGLLPFLLGLGLAVLIHPIACWMAKRGVRRRPAALLACLFFYLGIGGALWAVGWLARSQAVSLFSHLPQLWEETALALGAWLERVSRFLPRLFPIPTGQLMETLTQAGMSCLGSLSAAAMDGIAHLAAALPSAALALVLTLLSSVLITLDYNQVTGFLVSHLPRPVGEALLGSKRFLLGSMLRLCRAYFLILLLTFLELAAGLWLLGVDYFMAMAALIAALDILPVLGSGAVLLPWAAIELLLGRPSLGAGLAALWGVITLVRNVAEPRIVGQQLGLHPVATVTAMYMGLHLAGFLGMIAAPLLAMLAVFLIREGYLPTPPGKDRSPSP